MKTGIFVYRTLSWGIFSAVALLFLGNIVRLLLADVAAGTEGIFWPGPLLLLAVSGLAVWFGVTRVVKYVRLIRQNQSNTTEE